MSIEAKNISVFYDQKQVLKSVDFIGHSKEIVAIVGPNGSGKTTLLKTLSRLLKPKSGQVYIHGESMESIKFKTLAKKMAVLPQVRNIPEDFDVESLVTFGRYPHMRYSKRKKEDTDIVQWALEKTQMVHLKDQPLNELSGGERQRAWIAMALAQKTEIILLDEPTTFLDVAHQIEILDLIKDLNASEDVTIIMVLHDINHALSYAHRVYLLKEGLVVKHGLVTEVLKEEILKDVFGVGMDTYKDLRRSVPFLIPYGLDNYE